MIHGRIPLPLGKEKRKAKQVIPTMLVCFFFLLSSIVSFLNFHTTFTYKDVSAHFLNNLLQQQSYQNIPSKTL